MRPVIEVFRLSSAWSVELRRKPSAGSGRPRPLTEVDVLTLRWPDGALSWRGAPPPLARGAGEADLPRGIAADVVWRVGAGCLGPFVWVQSFRSGRETDTPAETAELRPQVDVSFGDLLRLLYAREPFERVLGPDFTARNFSVCSFISGLVHGEDGPRVGIFDAEQLAALLGWAEQPDLVTSLRTGTAS